VSESEIEAFISRWSKAGGSERANYQLFLTELCTLLDLPSPEPAGEDTRDNAYVFERRVVMPQPDGSVANGFIDLYRRGCFVLEAKQTGKTLDSSGWDKAMLRAQNQADQYARALPADEGRPPFIVVADVGRNIELYAEFSRSGATYTPYPDPRSHRIRIEDLRDEAIRQRLRAVWTAPSVWTHLGAPHALLGKSPINLQNLRNPWKRLAMHLRTSRDFSCDHYLRCSQRT
jgi:hypothetical protein